MRKTLEQALEEILVPAITPLGFKCILNKDSGRCHEVVFTNDSVYLAIFYDTLDDVSISLSFTRDSMRGVSYDEILKRMGNDSGGFVDCSGGWREGGLWIPDFENLFNTIAKTLPEILAFPARKLMTGS